MRTLQQGALEQADLVPHPPSHPRAHPPPTTQPPAALRTPHPTPPGHALDGRRDGGAAQKGRCRGARAAAPGYVETKADLRLLSVPEHACLRLPQPPASLRPASADQPLGPRWPVIRAVFPSRHRCPVGHVLGWNLALTHNYSPLTTTIGTLRHRGRRRTRRRRGSRSLRGSTRRGQRPCTRRAMYPESRRSKRARVLPNRDFISGPCFPPCRRPKAPPRGAADISER